MCSAVSPCCRLHARREAPGGQPARAGAGGAGGARGCQGTDGRVAACRHRNEAASPGLPLRPSPTCSQCRSAGGRAWASAGTAAPPRRPPPAGTGAGQVGQGAAQEACHALLGSTEAGACIPWGQPASARGGPAASGAQSEGRTGDTSGKPPTPPPALHCPALPALTRLPTLAAKPPACRAASACMESALSLGPLPSLPIDCWLGGRSCAEAACSGAACAACCSSGPEGASSSTVRSRSPCDHCSGRRERGGQQAALRMRCMRAGGPRERASLEPLWESGCGRPARLHAAQHKPRRCRKPAAAGKRCAGGGATTVCGSAPEPGSMRAGPTWFTSSCSISWCSRRS